MCVGVGVGASVTAQAPLPLELRWDAPAECPSGPAVRAELERIARARPGEALLPLAADAQVRHRGTRYQVTLQTEHAGQRGQRELEARDCKTLVRTVTFVLALAFGPSVELEPDAAGSRSGDNLSVTRSASLLSPTASQPPAAADRASAANAEQPLTAAVRKSAPTAEPQLAAAGRERAANTERDAPTRDVPASAHGPSIALSWVIALGGSAQLLPRTSLLASTGPELRYGALSIAGRALFWPGTTTNAGPSVEAHWLALGASLQVCWNTHLLYSLELAACGGGRGVSVHARASGDVEPLRVHAPYGALTGSAALSWPRATWIRLRVELSLAMSLSRPRFVIEGLREIYRVPGWNPDMTAGAHVTF